MTRRRRSDRADGGGPPAARRSTMAFPELALRPRVLVEAVGRYVEPRDALRALAGPGAILMEDGAGGRFSYLCPPGPGPLLARDPHAPQEDARLLLRQAEAERPEGAPPFCGGLA